VRGLDYYNRTVFEWTTTDLGAQATICAGGRYNALNPMQNQRWGKGCRPFFRPNHRSAHPHISWLVHLSQWWSIQQFKKADKANADFAIILGEEELNNNQVAIKPLKGQGKQQEMRIEDAINYLKGQI
jgi:histidyl-tRNA synthetase